MSMYTRKIKLKYFLFSICKYYFSYLYTLLLFFHFNSVSFIVHFWKYLRYIRILHIVSYAIFCILFSMMYWRYSKEIRKEQFLRNIVRQIQVKQKKLWGYILDMAVIDVIRHLLFKMYYGRYGKCWWLFQRNHISQKSTNVQNLNLALKKCN